MPLYHGRRPAGAAGPSSILPSVSAVLYAVEYVAPEAIGDIARHVDVTEAYLTEVRSFYPDLRTCPCGPTFDSHRHGRILRGQSLQAHSFRLGDELTIGLKRLMWTMRIEDHHLMGNKPGLARVTIRDRYE